MERGEIMNEEIWRELEVRGIKYLISNYGRIIGARGKILKTRTDEYGYETVTVGITKFRSREAVHRLVARAFIPKPNEVDCFEVNHKDFNRKNNRVENLEWVTHKDNIKYSYENNSEAQYLARDGVKNGRATFSDDDILEIRRLYNDAHISIAEISRIFNSKHSTIGNIVHNQTWKHLL